jgi:hypothetical protein
MRANLVPAFAAVMLVISATAAHAQVVPGEGIVLSEGVGIAPVLPPSVYAASMLPPTATYPWVMVPRFSTAATDAAGIGYGDRFSPYGIYSRYPFYATGPFPAVARPPARFDNGHCHHKTHDYR